VVDLSDEAITFAPLMLEYWDDKGPMETKVKLLKALAAVQRLHARHKGDSSSEDGRPI
jgi:hypothetical protein